MSFLVTIKKERESIEREPRPLLQGEVFELLNHDAVNHVLHLRTLDGTRDFYAEESPLEELP